jgi:dsDNA-specific endonuclease/ATPase MutS2
MGRVKQGDWVRFVDEVGEGRVIRIISEHMVEVETSDGWVLPVYQKNLVVIPEHKDAPDIAVSIRDEKIIREVLHEKEVKNSVLNAPPAAKPAKAKQPPREVDLHINKITDTVIGLTNTEILTIQMEVFRRELNRSIRENESEIIFIHGIGNGTLKGELRRALDRDFSWCSQEDASFREYGFGATRVRIPQNKPPFC